MTVGFALDPLFERHENPAGHPERPARLRAVAERLGECGLLDRGHAIEARQIEREQLLRVHDEGLIAAHERMHAAGGGTIDADTHMSARSWPIALLAAGATVAAAEAVAEGVVSRAFVAPRPPGHHATPTQAMGFCLVNNVAIAARHLIATERARRVVIVDFDVHHGNGTQDIVYADPSVVYASIHEAGNYPGTGWARETGAGEGDGTIFNRPFPAGTDPAVIRRGLSDVLDEVRERLAPDFVFISAGFDGHRLDPLAGWALEGEDYAAMTRDIVSLADATAGGRVVSVLEGGYSLEGLAEGVEAHVGALG
jgi:acetoin utilization deacetylase AcuC-like enzyme